MYTSSNITKRIHVFVQTSLNPWVSLASVAGLPLPRKQGPGLPPRGRRVRHGKFGALFGSNPGVTKSWTVMVTGDGDIWGHGLG